MILDTTYLIHLGERDPAAFAKGVELAESRVVQWLPVPVIQELEYGIEFGGTEDEKRHARNATRLYPTVRITEAIARRAGQLLAQADLDYGGVGEAGIDSIDPMIAAIADTLNDSVLTKNVKHFERLGVAVETY